MAGQNKRVELTEPAGPLRVVYRDIPEPPQDGLVVKTHYAGICHTDVYVWRDTFRITDDMSLSLNAIDKSCDFAGLVMGHEVSGEVHSLGNNYTGNLQVGSLVVVYPWCGCDRCDNCKGGGNLQCKDMLSNNLGVGQPGGYQQYMSVRNVKYVFSAPEGIPMDVLSLMSCSGLTSYNAVSKVMPAVQAAVDRKGHASMLVVGAGGLGIWGLKWSKAILPEGAKVFVADISDDKLQFAMNYGADESVLWDTIVSEEDLVSLTKDKTDGVDGSVDFVGLPTTNYKAIMSTNKGGSYAAAGLAGGTCKLPLVPMILNGITFFGIVVGTLQQMREQLEVYVEKKLSGPPITHVSPEEAERCIKELAAGTFQGRYVIDWTKEQ